MWQHADLSGGRAVPTSRAFLRYLLNAKGLAELYAEFGVKVSPRGAERSTGLPGPGLVRVVLATVLQTRWSDGVQVYRAQLYYSPPYPRKGTTVWR